MPRIYCTPDLRALPNRAARLRQERAAALAMFLAYILLCGIAGWLS